MEVLKSCAVHKVEQIVCNHCKSLLKYDERDIKVERWSVPCTINEDYHYKKSYITCPECNIDIELGTEVNLY